MIVLYKGARGKGKTLTMCKDALNFQNKGWKVYSNMNDLKVGEYISNEYILSIDKKEKKIFNCVLIIDEIQTLFDSRTSTRTQNRDFSYFLQQIRKRNVVLLCTTQFSNTIDKRLRQHLDILAVPNFLKKYLLCRVKYIDLRTIEDLEIGLGLTEPNFIEVVFDCRKIFKLYNTEELIS